jgi:FkbM family methyltransferase
MIVPKYIRGDDVVLEFGARYGSVSCMINNQLWDNTTHVCVEPDKTVWDSLEKNRKRNHCNFHILKGFVSNTKQKMVALNAWDGYGARSVEATEKNTNDPPSYTLDAVKKKYGLKFNVFVADCEGCLEKFFDENPKFYDELRLFIFERDYPETCNYPKIEKELLKRGFKAVLTGHQNVYEREYIPKTRHVPKTRKPQIEEQIKVIQQRPRTNIKPRTRKIKEPNKEANKEPNKILEQTKTIQQRPRKNIKPRTRKNKETHKEPNKEQSKQSSIRNKSS